MGTMFMIVFLLVSVFIVGLVLLQEGKGGGLTGMSTGMDGVMGAKNPLRRMTAYLFVIFVLMAVTINWYFHQRSDTALPAGAAVTPAGVRTLEQNTPFEPTAVMPEPVTTDAVRPTGQPAAPAAPAAPIRPADSAMPAPPPEAAAPAGAETPKEVAADAEKVAADVAKMADEEAAVAAEPSPAPAEAAPSAQPENPPPADTPKPETPSTK